MNKYLSNISCKVGVKMNGGKYKLIESKNGIYPWYNNERVSFKGYFLYNGIFYSGNLATNKIFNLVKTNGFDKTLEVLNGFFSIIYRNDDSIFFANDRLRAFPLFYARINDEISISDDVEELIKNIEISCNLKYNSEAINEFKSTSLFTTGDKTLIESIYQVEAGQKVRYNLYDGTLTKKFYFRYNHDNLVSNLEKKNIEALKNEFKIVYFEQVGRDLVESLNGKYAIVPLSGGADSRMIISMLKKFNYQNVICYTYGDSKSKEVKISQKVARDNNYEWHLVEYNNEIWRVLKENSIYDNYLKYSGKYTSCPHIQDLYAIYYLKNKGIIPNNSVFIPGHSGDMVAGSHITKDFIESNSISQSKLMDLIIKKHYLYIENNKVSKKLVEGYIQKNLINKNVYSSEEAVNEYEYFNMIERQAKFICNSVRAYEFFGFEWRMPLWDNRVISFWSHVPVDLRYQRKFYFEAIGEEKIESTNDQTIIKSLASFVRNNLPVLRTVFRYAFRIKEYFNHPFRWGYIVPFKKYLRYLFLGGENFQINYIVSHDYIVNNIKDKSWENDD